MSSLYNDINLPTGIHYSASNDGGRDVYYSYAARDNLPKTTTFGSSRVVTNSYDGLTRLDNVRYDVTGEDAADLWTDYSYLDYGGDSEERPHPLSATLTIPTTAGALIPMTVSTLTVLQETS